MHVYHIITVKNNVPFSIAENWNELIYIDICQVILILVIFLIADTYFF